MNINVVSEKINTLKPFKTELLALLKKNDPKARSVVSYYEMFKEDENDLTKLLLSDAIDAFMDELSHIKQTKNHH